MKKFVLRLLIMILAFSVNAQRKVETTYLKVKSVKNAKILGTDSKGNLIDKSLSLSTPNLQSVTNEGNNTTNDIITTSKNGFISGDMSKTYTQLSNGVYTANNVSNARAQYLNSSIQFMDYDYSNRTWLKKNPAVSSSINVLLPYKSGTIALEEDIPAVPIYKAGKNITIDNTNPLQPIINSISNSGVNSIVAGTNVSIDNTDSKNPVINVNGGINSTDLTYTAAPTQGTVNSSNGNNAVIPLANQTNAGLMYAGFSEISTENATATIIAHQDNAINSGGSVSLSSSNINVSYVKEGRLKRLSFNLGISWTGILSSAKGDFIIKIPLLNHSSIGEGAALPLVAGTSNLFTSAFRKNDEFYCNGSFNTNSGEVLIRVKINPDAFTNNASSGTTSFHFNLIYRD